MIWSLFLVVIKSLFIPNMMIVFTKPKVRYLPSRHVAR